MNRVVHPPLELVAALDDAGVIGQRQQLPWKLPEDLRHFRALTLHKAILMGRTTWESLPRPLDQRRNVVLSRQVGFQAEGAEVYATPEQAWQALRDAPVVMVMGGAEIYRQLLPLAVRLHLTRVAGTHAGDAFFPRVDWRQWVLQDEEKKAGYGFQTWLRDKSLQAT